MGRFNSDHQADPVDMHVGARVRLRRHQCGVSQEKLGEALGLTFQQVQKYERGANRVSASKLHKIATFLDTPVAWFFEGLPDAAGVVETPAAVRARLFVNTPEGLQLCALWDELDEAARQPIVALLRLIAPAPEQRQGRAA